MYMYMDPIHCCHCLESSPLPQFRLKHFVYHFDIIHVSMTTGMRNMMKSHQSEYVVAMETMYYFADIHFTDVYVKLPCSNIVLSFFCSFYSAD